MIYFVLGEQNSGKSAIAEDIACSLDEKRVYLATMKIMDDEGVRRVERHRKMRQNKGFETVECMINIADIDVSFDSVVLLECISNLVGNVMFDEHCITVDETVETVMSSIDSLSQKVKNLVIVSSIYYADQTVPDSKPDEATKDYLKALDIVNNRIKMIADDIKIINSK